MSSAAAQNVPPWAASPFSPPALPLAVRSPYLNTWAQQGNNPASLSNLWPRLWDGSITDWYASVIVDGQAYRIMGQAAFENVAIANQTAAEFTATHTSFLLQAGPMQINASFISSIEPTDLLRQSLPFSYLSISASSTDGNAHNLRVYSDISGEFIAGNVTQVAQWNSTIEEQYVILSMQLQQQEKYKEVNNHASDATEYYALKKISGTTISWSITEDTVSRANAANASTTLGNRTDDTPRGVSDRWPVLEISIDWGSIQQTQEPAVWAIGVMRRPVIPYRGPSGSLEERYPFYISTYGDGVTAAKAFLDDYSRAFASASAFDAFVSTSGNQISADYAHMLALSTLQVLSSLDITVSAIGSGGWNTPDVKVFMKNMGRYGSDITETTISTTSVDALYAAFPVFLFLNPELGGALLLPLLEYQHSSAYTANYSVRCIGSAYPDAQADERIVAPDYGVEEAASMLIMTLAYSQRSGNGTVLGQHYSLLRGWADYLEGSALTPTNQKSADFFPEQDVSKVQSNLALKGIIAIAAMAKIAESAGVSADQEHFSNVSKSYIDQWEKNAIPADEHDIDFSYGDNGSKGLIYNLYADKLLQLNAVPSYVYDIATTFYTNAVDQTPCGIPLDSNHANRTTINGMIFAASTLSDSGTRDKMISKVHAYAAANVNGTALPIIYNPSDGTMFGAAGTNSPASGSVFALLALNTTIKTISVPSGVIATISAAATATSIPSMTNPNVDTTALPSAETSNAGHGVTVNRIRVLCALALACLVSITLPY